MNDEIRLLTEAYPTIAELNTAHNTFLAQNIYTKKLYVKKVLSRYSLSVFRYLKEHPAAHMPAIIDFAEDEGTLVVIEEYIHGETLQYRMDNRGLLSADEAVQYALQICGILKALHGATPPIIHRDIKPDNIMLTPEGTLWLLDMNAARQMTKDGVRDTQLLGTVGYAAPEQYGFRQSDAQTDIYSVGVLLNEMVTGSLPAQRMAPGALAPVISRCTQLSPKDRFADVQELEAALRALLSPRSAQACEPWQKYLPPGFRALVPGKMVASLVMFVAGVSLTLSLDATDASFVVLWSNRILTTLLFLFFILFNGNYLGFQYLFPGMNRPNRWVRCLLILLYDAIALVIVAVTTNAIN